MRIFKKVLSGIVTLLAVLLLLHAAWNWTATRALNSTWRSHAEMGLPMSVQEIAPQPVPVEDNAAPVLSRAFAAMTRDAAEAETYAPAFLELMAYGIPDVPDNGGIRDVRTLSAEQRARLLNALASPPVSEAVDLLDEAGRKPECNFGVDYTRGASMLLPHLSHMRNGVRLLCLRAWLRAEAGQIERALRDIHTALRIADFLKSEPVLISQLVRVAGNHTCATSLNAILRTRDPESLPDTELQALVSQFKVQADEENANLVAALDGERILLGNWCFERIIRGKMDREELQSLGMPTGLRFYGGYIGRPWMKTDFRYYMITMAEYRARARKPIWEIVRQPSLADSIPHYYLLARMILPALDSTYRTMARNNAEMELCRIGLMIARHKKETGHCPVSLGELPSPDPFPRDPFSGHQYVYRPSESGFVLYSVGPDLEDDGGKPLTSSGETGDLVWQIDC